MEFKNEAAVAQSFIHDEATYTWAVNTQELKIRVNLEYASVFSRLNRPLWKREHNTFRKQPLRYSLKRTVSKI